MYTLANRTITTPATDPFRPSPPGGVFASAGPDSLEASIAWDPSTEDDVTEYTIYRYDGASWNQQSIFYWDENTEAWVSGTTVPHPFHRAKLTQLTEGVSVTLLLWSDRFPKVLNGDVPYAEHTNTQHSARLTTELRVGDTTYHGERIG